MLVFTGFPNRLCISSICVNPVHLRFEKSKCAARRENSWNPDFLGVFRCGGGGRKRPFGRIRPIFLDLAKLWLIYDSVSVLPSVSPVHPPSSSLFPAMKPRSHHRGLALLSCVTLSASPFAHAATYTWTGADSNWRSSYSWNAASVPVAGDSLILTGSGNLTSYNGIAANTVFRNLTFDSSASAFTVRGSDFGITGSI